MINSDIDYILTHYNFSARKTLLNSFSVVTLPNEKSVEAPDLYALHKITKNEEFLAIADNVIQKISDFDENTRYTISTNDIGPSVQTNVGRATVSFLHYATTC